MKFRPIDLHRFGAPKGTIGIALSQLFTFARLTSAINDVAPGGEIRTVAGLNEDLGEGEWIRVAPYGEHRNKVGLQVFDRPGAEAMVKAFNSVETRLATMFRGLPIYEGHPDDPEWKRQNPGIRVAAVGRVKKLEARDDGLWAIPAWNETGERMVRGAAPAYTAQSPHWGMLPIGTRPNAFRPVELWSLGLTNQPNITGTHLGINELDSPTPMKELLIKLLAALGMTVAADATDEAITTAATAAVEKAAGAKPAAAEVAELKPKLEAAQNEVASLTTKVTELTAQHTAAINSATTERTARAAIVITSAINEGRVTEAQRVEFTSQLVAATDFEAKAKEIGQLKKAINTKSQLTDAAARKGESAVDSSKLSAINEAVSKKMSSSNLAHHDAYLAVKKEQPALFAATNG